MMTLNDNYWQTEFDITGDDLNRIANRMRQNKAAYTLTDLVKRLVQGRLEHGKDDSPSALPDWIQQELILSWDAIDRWCVGCRVLVAKRDETKQGTTFTPFFGTITKADRYSWYIKLDGIEIEKKYKVNPDKKEAQEYFDTVNRTIWEKERSAQDKPLSIEEQVDINVIRFGDQIGGLLLTVLQHDARFILIGEKWSLRELLVSLSPSQIEQLHRKMISLGGTHSLKDLIPLVSPTLREDEIGYFSLEQALSTVQTGWFEIQGTPENPTWQALKPPPPPWQEAKGAFFVYDPVTYEIILQPEQDLNKHLADRLQELGWYDDLVVGS